MSNEIKKAADEANNVASCTISGCCGTDVGTIIDNEDCVFNYVETFVNEADAQVQLAKLTAAAKEIESEPCVITSSMTPVTGGVELKATFSFSCGTENLIFQLKLRSLN